MVQGEINLVEYTFIQNESRTRIPPKKRLSFAAFMGVFQIFFIIAFWYYIRHIDYATYSYGGDQEVRGLYGSKSLQSYLILF